MKKLSVIAFVLPMLCLVTLAEASINNGDTVKITQGPGGGGGGGSFIADDQTAPDTPNFQTFCIELNEYFSTGGSYYVTIEDRAIYGGLDTDDNGGAGAAGVDGSYDPLSPLTAWLYRRAMGGTLAGYTLSDNADNNVRQAAIWYIEDEAALPAGDATTWYNAALAAYTSSPFGIGDVRVMNVWESAATRYTQGGKKQSMLVLIPEASTVAVWSVLSLLGIGAAYRKRAQA